MRLGVVVGTLVLTALPAAAGTLFSGFVDSLSQTPMMAGTYAGGLELTIAATGTANLNYPSSLIITNPDGSLLAPVASASCVSCWAPGYQFFIEGSAYPTVAGGDGLNHFVGGGGNFDVFPGDHSAWAAEGKQTTDTTDPGAIRFGALAYAFVHNPGDTPGPTDWLPLVQSAGNGNYGNTISTGNGGTLMVVIVDTFYPNNSGGFDLTVSTPEPSVTWLVFSGLGLLALRRLASRRRAH